MKPFQIKARLLGNRRVGGDCYVAALEADPIARAAVPGQFVMVKVSAGDAPLLRRPLGIHRLVPGLRRGQGGRRGIELLYEVVGPGTRILAQKRPGEYLDIIGPLGNGFSLAPAEEEVRSLLVAGGMGVAPLVFLAEKLKEVKSKKSKVKILVLLGAKNKDHILCEKEFRRLECEVRVATDDASKGHKGYVSELLKEVVSNPERGPWSIYACGPRPMLAAVSGIAKTCGIPAQVSLEEHMACGIGACLGCAVSTKDGFKRACKEGPVFDIDEIVWG